MMKPAGRKEDQAMSAKLIEPAAGDAPAREIALSGEEFLIGRGADCNLRLAVSAISRHHCLIRLHEREATLMDLGSANGTFLNGQRVRSPMPLHTGDEIKVGACRFLVDLGDTSGLDLAAGADANAATAKLRMPPKDEPGA